MFNLNIRINELVKDLKSVLIWRHLVEQSFFSLQISQVN